MDQTGETRDMVRFLNAARYVDRQRDNIARRNGYRNYNEALTGPLDYASNSRFVRMTRARYGRNTRLGLGSGK